MTQEIIVLFTLHSKIVFLKFQSIPPSQILAIRFTNLLLNAFIFHLTIDLKTFKNSLEFPYILRRNAIYYETGKQILVTFEYIFY